MYDFNTITKETETLTKAKFRDNGTGIKMGSYSTGDVAKWEDLTNSNLYSINSIKTKMLEIARRINTTCNDSLLGDLNVAFDKVDERDNKISFTWLEMYTFLRSVYRFRIETAEYKTKKEKLKRLETFIESNKSNKEKLKEAKLEAKALLKDISGS